MQFSISHVLFKWLGPLPSIIICLPPNINLLAVRVLRSFRALHADQNLGCSLRVSFHSLCFPPVALSSLFDLSEDLAISTAVTISSLGLWIRLAQTLQASQPVLAWTFSLKENLFWVIQKLPHSLVNYQSWCLRFAYQILLFRGRFKRFKHQSLSLKWLLLQ